MASDATVKMFENDSIHAFQRSTPKRSKQPNMVDPAKLKRDEFIMDTNNSSIVSKRSVEKLYWTGEPEYFRYFVSKFKRRSPLINRGYWLRMRAIEHTVQRFLEEPSGKRKVVVNLGCGYDPLPWLFIGKRPHLCDNAMFIDVDYPQLMQKKREVIEKTEPLSSLLPNLVNTGKDNGIMLQSDNYYAVGCDLRNLDQLSLIFRDQLQIEDCSVAILFVAEVSTAYMDLEGSQAVLEWAAHYDDARFCLLEQHLPDGADHPFAQTMLKHFEKLRTPLTAVGTMDQMKQRFATAGWPINGIDIRALWDLWSDPDFLSPDDRMALDDVEPFDEWEEFALFASHYFLLVARKPAEGKTNLDGDNKDKMAAFFDRFKGEEGEPATFQQFDGPHSYRRFAALLPSTSDWHTANIHAGLGTKERLTTTDTYYFPGSCPKTTNVGPPLRTGLMCHTISLLANGSDHAAGDCLLVGGRTSPEKASADCWLRRDGQWKRVQSLPEGRYRHCAVTIDVEGGSEGVLVYGGKSGQGTVLGSFLLWTAKAGWKDVAIEIDRKNECPPPPARFGAVMTVNEKTSGIIVGGMTKDGTIIEDCWEWNWSYLHSKVVLKDNTFWMRHDFGRNSRHLFRFGAQISYSYGVEPEPTYLFGGIVGSRMLSKRNEILNLGRCCTHPLQGPRPLLVGHSTWNRLLLGGGSTCFSFGTYWNASGEFTFSDERTEKPSPSPWQLLPEWLTMTQESNTPTPTAHPSASVDRTVPEIISIPKIQLTEAGSFEQVLASSRPVIFKACDLGPCTTVWDNTYLSTRIGPDRKVVVHASPSPKMDFQRKNFKYETLPFADFLNAAASGSELYLRALSQEAPSEKVTNLSEDFSSIAPDFQLPPELKYVIENAHSSPLRISGPVTMWLHYDVMANVLCQVRGKKRLLLYPPSDVGHLGFEAGASSSSIDVFEADTSTYPSLAHTHPHEALLEPGDVLFLPPLWLHTAAPTEGLSVAVNVFFRSLESGYAAGRDVYGNRDLAAYEKGRRDVGKIAKAFEGLPADVGRFYMERLGRELLDLARKG